MAQEVANLFVTLRADTTQVQRGLADTKRRLEQTGAAARTTSADFSFLTRSVGTLGVALGVTGLARAAIQMGELSARARRAEVAFRAFSGGAAEATANLEAIRRGTSGLLSEMQAQQEAARLMSMGLANNAKELERVTRLAVTLGAAMGRDVNTSLEQFALLLANQSILRLDTFGISAERVRERLEELQTEIQGLDRQTAFVMATLEIGEQKLRTLEAAGFDATSGMDELRVALRDTATIAAKQFGPSIDAAAGSLARFLEAANRVTERRMGFVEVVRETADELERLGQVEEAAALRRQALAIERAAPGAGARARQNIEAILEAADAEAIFTQRLEESRGRLQAVNPELMIHSRVARDVATSADLAQEQADALNQVLTDLGPEAFAATDGLSVLRGEIEATGAAATEAGARALAAIGVLQRLRTTRPELFDPQFNQATPAETRGVATGVAGRRRTLEDVEAAERVLVESNRKNTQEWFDNWEQAQRDAEAAAKKAAREAESAYEKALREMERAAEERFGNIKSAVADALDLSGQIGQFDKLLDEALPGSRELGPGEIIRRLMSVVNEGAEGGGRQWAEFYANLLGWDPATMNLTNDEIKARAAQLIQDIQSGKRLREALNLELTPGLTGRDALKQQARAAFLNEREMASVIEEVSKELEAEGLGLATDIQSSLGEQFGVQFGESDTAGQMVTTVTDGIKTAIANKAADIEAQGKAYGAAFKKGLLDEVAGAGSDLLEAIAQRVVSMMVAGAQGAAG
jgi:hypothetical protein